MVKCKSKHIFCGINFHLKNTFTIAAKGVTITSCCLMDLNGAEQLLITTSNLEATILKLPDLA